MTRVGLVALLLLAFAAHGAHAAPQEASGDRAVDWVDTWADLARVKATQDGALEEPGLRRSLEQRARAAISGTDVLGSTRGHLLLAQLALAGDEQSPSVDLLARCSLVGLDGAEAWLLAETLRDGPARIRAILHALRRTPEPSNEQRNLAWRTGVVESRALRLAEGALPIQRALHERYLASWSASNLGQTLTRLGDLDGLNAVLGDAIQREESEGRPTTDLWSEWGIALAGFGDESRARDYLGRALVRGSSDAAIVLARMDLVAGRMAAARSGFRPSILSDPPGAWALRGWGTSLLPAPHTPPETDPPHRQP